MRDLLNGAGQVHPLSQVLGHPPRQFGGSAVHEMGFGSAGVGVVVEAAAAPGQGEGAQQRDLRRVGAEQQIHGRPEQGAGGRRGHVQRAGKPLPERTSVPRPGTPGAPRGIRREAPRHQIQPHKRQTEGDERPRARGGDATAVTVVDSVQAQDVSAPLVLGIHLKSQLLAELEHAVLSLAQPGAACRYHRAVGQRPVPHPPAHPVPGLEYHHLETALHESSRGCEPGETRAHHAYVCL